jgi:hypothetical protein
VFFRARKAMTVPSKHPRSPVIAAALVVALVVALLSSPSFDWPGAEQDEGQLLAYPTQVLGGAVPGRDFEHVYGPANVWSLAGVFAIFGTDLETERAVGLIYRLTIVLAVFALISPWGIWVAAASGLLTAFVLLPVGLPAYASQAALGLGLSGLALLASAPGALAEPVRERRLLVAGVVCGVALLFRPDFAPAILLGSLPLLGALDPRGRKRYLIGILGPLLLYIPYLAVVGPERVERIARDIAAFDARRLPLPSISTDEGQLLFVLAAAMALLLLASVASLRSQPSRRARTVLAFALLLVGISWYPLSRADFGHIVPPLAIAVGALPAGLILTWQHLSPRTPRLTRDCISIAAIALAMVLTAPGILRATAEEQLRDLWGGAGRGGAEIEWRGRSFVVASSKVARDIQALLVKVEDVSSPGDYLFVGPRNLSRSIYGDTFIYYLLPDLRPASYYMEFNPQGANANDSGLADDLLRADVLILTPRYDFSFEPNESGRPGSVEPLFVLIKHFCLRAQEGHYFLYRRCEKAAAAARRRSSRARTVGDRGSVRPARWTAMGYA